jgi:hypothetical protein
MEPLSTTQRGRRSRRPPRCRSASLSCPCCATLEDLGGACTHAVVVAVLEDLHRSSLLHPGCAALEDLGGVVGRRGTDPPCLPELHHACQSEEEVSHRAGPPPRQRNGPPPGHRIGLSSQAVASWHRHAVAVDHCVTSEIRVGEKRMGG